MQKGSVREILERTDIVVLIKTTEPLKKTGKYWRGVDHDSLVVDPVEQSFFWNSKGISGSAIDWLVKVKNLTFQEAIRQLGEVEDKYRDEKEVKKAESLYRYAPQTALVYWHSMMDKTGRRSYFYSRGLTDETIDREMLGWDGKRYVIPIWDGEPQESQVLNVALRASELCTGPKYISVDGISRPTVAGKWHCRQAHLILGFVGLFDFLLAYQDGFKAFTFVPGQAAMLSSEFPKDWPNVFFPDARFLILPWDKGETVSAGYVVQQWHRYKGRGPDGKPTALVEYWPIEEEGVKDYSGYRAQHTRSEFFNEIFIPQIKEVRKVLVP